MDPAMLTRLVALVEANLFATALFGVVYGLLGLLIVRELRAGHQALARLEASAEHIAQMVHDLHRDR